MRRPLQPLERQIAELTRERDALQLAIGAARMLLARRAARIAELELALDAAHAGARRASVDVFDRSVERALAGAAEAD